MNDELNIIRNLAERNGFKLDSINKLINYYRNENIGGRDQAVSENYKGESECSKVKRVSFPYMKGSFERLKFKFKKFDIDLIVKPPHKLKVTL